VNTSAIPGKWILATLIATAWMPATHAQTVLRPSTPAADTGADLDALRPTVVLGARLESAQKQTTAAADIDALQDALLALDQSHHLRRNTLQRQQIQSLLGALEDTVEGRASLPESALCLADRGLPQLLARSPRSVDVAAVQSASAAVCARSGEYAVAPGAAVSDPFAAPVAAAKDLGPFEFACSRVGIRTPDMPGINPYYELDGYALSVNSSTITLEEGQRFAVRTPCAPKLSAGVTTSYGSRVRLSYTPSGGSATTIELDDFVADGLSVGMPQNFYPASYATQADPAPINGTLRFQTVRRTCSLGCTYTLVGVEVARAFKVERLGSMCNVDTRFHDFAINDRLAIAGEFMHNNVDELNVDPAFGLSDPTFHAYARTSTLVQTSVPPYVPYFESSFPAYNAVTGFNNFVVHRDDQLSIHNSNISRGTFINEMGTTVLAGLRYPRVISDNFITGQAFSYTCKPRKIVRDFVGFCTAIGKPNDSLYLLPYHGKTLTVQGNNGAISHNDDYNRYAWDFETELASNKGIYAARGGRVIDVEESQSGNCSGCDNNYIKIRHQDGSEGHYLHGQYNGAAVSVGQIVARGAYLGESGNVGNSAIRHIHFSAHSGNTGFSIRSSFDDQSEACVVPSGPFDTKESTLTPGQDMDYKYLSAPQDMPHKR